MGISETLEALGARARRLRLLRNLTQQDLATKSGVGLKALRRFESTGGGTLETAVRIAFALRVPDPFGGLFEPPRYNSLAEAEAEMAAETRQRARRKRS